MEVIHGIILDAAPLTHSGLDLLLNYFLLLNILFGISAFDDCVGLSTCTIEASVFEASLPTNNGAYSADSTVILFFFKKKIMTVKT